MKIRSICFVLYALGALGSKAQITISINNAGFSNAFGEAVDGAPFGVLVDLAGDGFAVGDYAGFDLDLSGQFLTSRFGETDDWFVRPQIGSLRETVLSPLLGSGTISSFEIELEAGVEGDAFALIWFPELSAGEGLSYGVFTHEDLVLAEPGGTAALNSVIDPGPASYVFDGSLATIPEPSALVALGGLAALLGRLRRRR